VFGIELAKTPGKETTMKKRPSLALVLGVTVVLLAFGLAALAADTAAKPAAKTVKPAPTAPAAKTTPAAPAAKPAPTAPAAKPAAAPKAGQLANEVKCVVSGKIETKVTEKRKGKEVKRCLIQVSEAKGADGKAIDALKGKSLRVVGPKVADVEKLVGKNAELTGKVIDGKRIQVETVK
jgi:pyruvate/2-oxoglutarate dehydrogenase complex dihydrolipoamide acyltransferase (E2) component